MAIRKSNAYDGLLSRQIEESRKPSDNGATCDNIVLASNTSNMVIKAMSLFQDQVVLLFGEENKTTSVFLHHYRAHDQITRTDRVMFSLELDKGDVIEQGPLEQVFPGMNKHMAKYEIVSMIYIHERLVVFFFRDPTSNKVCFALKLKMNYLCRCQLI